MLQSPCCGCSSPLALGAPACPQCGTARPTQAALHLAAALRYLQDGRPRRALDELAAARQLQPALEEINQATALAAQALAQPRPADRFVDASNLRVDVLPWGPHDWLCRPDIVEAEDLLLVRVHMPPGQGHAFHRHPAMEEIIYVEQGEAEQWVDRQSRRLTAGQLAHIPRDVVHGTYNGSDQELRFLAILSPARFAGPALIDVSQDAPWRDLRTA